MGNGANVFLNIYFLLYFDCTAFKCKPTDENDSTCTVTLQIFHLVHGECLQMQSIAVKVMDILQ